jgi:hypothetical protein
MPDPERELPRATRPPYGLKFGLVEQLDDAATPPGGILPSIVRRSAEPGPRTFSTFSDYTFPWRR